MKMNPDMVCLGLDWSEPTEPSLRVAKRGLGEPSHLIPVEGAVRFRVLEPDIHYCAGWFDLTGPEPRHVNCQSWERISAGKQCRRCQFKEGFLAVHQAHRGTGRLPENVRAYLMQRHWLYLDIFADGTSKVGTVAEARLGSRLAEQGAVAACYVAFAKDGVDIRKAESAVSTQFNLRQALTAKRKLEAMQSRVELSALREKLSTLVRGVQTSLASMAADSGWIEVERDPTWWTLPPSSAAAFKATPVMEYPQSMTSGDHSLYVKGIAGPIAVFSINEDEAEPQLYAGDLSRLHGVALRFGDFQSTVQSVQASLF